MQEELPSDMAFDFPKDTDDLTNICRLSTILVATIQEVKDRVSQIEFIFCSQLFPSFQSRSKHLQRLEDVKRASEGEWKEKEKSMLSQIEQLLENRVYEKKNADAKIQQLSSTLEQNEKRLADAEKLIGENEIEKMHLIHKLQIQVKNEDAICQLKDQLKEKNMELEEEKESRKRLTEEAEEKAQNFLLEQGKRRDLFEDYNMLKTNYKQLKSQYLFLVNKYIQIHGTNGAQEDSLKPYQSKRALQDSEEKDMKIPKFTSKTSPLRIGLASNEKNEAHPDVRPNKRPNADSLISNLSSSSPKKKNSADMKSETRRKVSGSLWRETRTCQRQQDGDPHDDFLDTPMEIVKDLGKRPCEEPHDIPSPPPQDMDFNTDDETQDLNIKNNAKPSHITVHNQIHDQGTKIVPKPQRISVLDPANKGFKYIEPVRKKSERENLKGVQCQQCKKFYEAVLPDGGGKENSSRDFYCEHHDGVSRHRYRYAPPMTPEGFWNIGFDSEL